jgi:hypothetical protein
VVVSDRNYDNGPEKDDYMITVDKWTDLLKDLRRMVKSLIAKGNFMQTMSYRRTGMTISATVPMYPRTFKLSRRNISWT